MSKKGYLTSAEYRSIRQLLGFTQEEAAIFHNVGNVRTIKRWEKGESVVSELACDKITGLFEKINWVIAQAIEQASKLPSDKLDIVLIVYPDSCFQKYAVGFSGLPNSVHKAMIARTYSTFKSMGIKCGVVEFDAQDYFIFLAKNNLTDSQDVRGQWAVDYRDRLLIQ